MRKKALETELAKTKSVLLDYTKWEQDFGYLTLLINRKIEISKRFFLGILSDQLADSKNYIRDEDIQKEFNNIVSEIWNSISDNYKNFLVNKYFKDEQELIKFLAETVYSELVKIAITNNNDKISKIYSAELINKISELNKKA